jgi:DNA-binding YbaB/EbfC family protein
MKNLGQMMRQAQAMQEKVAKLQAELAEREVQGAAGGGLVSVTLNGKGEMRRVQIDKSLIRPEESEVLEDLIVAAHNEAKTKLEAELAQAMAELTGGLPLPPGFKLPF